MRELKFRAWYDGNMYFVNDLMFNSTGVYIATLVNTEMYHYQTNDIRTIELMQYTGIKDSKWQEIYEGDIVRVEGAENRIVVHGPASFQLASHMTGSRILLEDRNTDLLEVIGNIYEHKHLLPEDDGK